jgi:lipopolysaccharide/colanic/teichoic acid biosynthesis glycosyltransferase
LGATAPFGRNRGVARGVDIVAAAVGLVFFAPILLVIAAAIKLESPGPIFVHQIQYGPNNRRIEVLKFRLASAGARGDHGYPRPTWVGGVLRGTRVDELLGLINVLRGETSLVGHRA